MDPYFSIVYSLSGAKSDEVVQISSSSHRKLKESRQLSEPHICTNPSVLVQMDSFLEKDSLSDVFHQLLNESGGPIFSTPIISTEPRNLVQVANRKTVKERKLATTSFALFQP